MFKCQLEKFKIEKKTEIYLSLGGDTMNHSNHPIFA